MKDIKMRDVFNPPWKSVDYQNGIVDCFDNAIEFSDMHEIEKDCLCISVNNHDALVEQLAAAKAEIEKLSPLVEIASNQKQRIQQLEEQLTKEKAEIAEYRESFNDIIELANNKPGLLNLTCAIHALLAKHKGE